MWLMDLHGAFSEAVGFVADSTFELKKVSLLYTYIGRFCPVQRHAFRPSLHLSSRL